MRRLFTDRETVVERRGVREKGGDEKKEKEKNVKLVTSLESDIALPSTTRNALNATIHQSRREAGQAGSEAYFEYER